MADHYISIQQNSKSGSEHFTIVNKINFTKPTIQVLPVVKSGNPDCHIWSLEEDKELECPVIARPEEAGGNVLNLS